MASKLEMEPVGDGYRLRQTADGVTTEMVLTDESVLQLVQSSLRLRSHVLAKRLPSAANAVMVSRVVQIGLDRDILLPEVHLVMFLEDGLQQTFAVPLELAKSLVQALPKHITEAEQTQQNTQH
jgi:hypothetical protein